MKVDVSGLTYVGQVLRGMSQALKEELLLRFDDREARSLLDRTDRTFQERLPTVPDVGEDNPWLKSILGVAYLSGLWLELEDRGWSKAEMSILTQKALYRFTRKLVTAENFLHVRDALCSPETARAIAQRSALRAWPEDWIVEVVTPAGPEDGFQSGCNVYRCPIQKFCSIHGIERFFPYFCLDDYVMHAAMGVHLTRTSTIAHGASCCDFCLTALPRPYCRIIYEPEKLEEFQNPPRL